MFLQQELTKINDLLEVRPLSLIMGAEIFSVDLSKSVNEEIVTAIQKALCHYQLLLFRNQDITSEQQISFTGFFGEVANHAMNAINKPRRSASRVEGHPEIYYLSNLDEQDNPMGKYPDKGTLSWHSDTSWRLVTGGATTLYALEVPSKGGETSFANMYAAYDALEDDMKARLQGLRAIHSLEYSYSRYHPEELTPEDKKRIVPPVEHPVIRTHPHTGRKCIYLGDHASHIVEMDFKEGHELVKEINTFVTRPEFVYQHQWQPQDLIVWDNKCLLHRAGEFDTVKERRVMRRTTTVGEIPV